MKIPKVFHPILGVLIGFILFLAAIGLLSVVFVDAVKCAEYAKPFFMDFLSIVQTQLKDWFPT